MDNLTINLQRFDEIPAALYTCEPTELESILGGPSLFYVEGRQSPPLFVTVLQHGNEPTGFDAVQAILNKYREQIFPRSMWLFVANVAAAAKGLRVLDGQTDYNRAWPGTLVADSEEAKLMQTIVDTVTEQPLFASIDLHNNTGSNPHYACLNKLDTPFLHLARLFARTAVYYRQPAGTQSLAMADHCPAVTLECGKAGEEAALDHAVEYLDACLRMQQLPDHGPANVDIILLKTMATVKIKPDVLFGFGEGPGVRFRGDLDRYNFGLLKAGTWLATMQGHKKLPLTAITDEGEDVAADLFEICEDRLVTRTEITPSMATLDTDIIRQDCLFYIMQELVAD